MKSNKNYKFLSHTADIKFQASGKTIEEVFSNSALALSDVMTKGAGIRQKKKRKINIKARDFGSLLYNFLEEFLFLYDTKGFVLSSIEEIKIDKEKFALSAVVAGDTKMLSNDVKAVTYNDMKVEQKGKKWIVQCVLDV